jgi:hypothetical protein
MVMKKIVITMIILVFAAGCTSSTEKLRDANRRNLTKLSIGMTKAQAIKSMGKKVRGGRFGEALVNNPYKSEVIVRSNRTFEVMYYYTKLSNAFYTANDTNISDDELTPLVFEDEILLGWGQDFLKSVKANSEKGL